MKNSRPWGVLQTLEESENLLVKSISVIPGKQCSLHVHKNLEEHWIFISGVGVAIVGKQQIEVRPTQHIHIPANVPHRIINKGSKPLKYVEIILGKGSFSQDLQKLDMNYDAG